MNTKLNKFIAIFLCNQIMMQCSKFDYGNQIRLNDTKALNIMLPSINMNPDFDFMEQYIKEKYFNLKSKIKEKQKHEISDWRELNEVEWGDYQISELFNHKIGKNIDGNKINKQNGFTPYVTRKEANNGIDGFILESRELRDRINIVDESVITIGNETAMPFVHRYNFYTGTKVNILSPKFKSNTYTMHFVKLSCNNIRISIHILIQLIPKG